MNLIRYLMSWKHKADYYSSLLQFLHIRKKQQKATGSYTDKIKHYVRKVKNKLQLLLKYNIWKADR